MSAGDPITWLCIVDKKSNCPPHYFVLERTSEGEEADLWKDGFFKKTTRYICYTKNVTASQWNHVLTNLVLVGAKDAVPQGYTVIRETLDTKEQALRRQTLCYQLLPKTATPSAICDIQLMRTDRYKSKRLTFVGKVNGFNLVYKLSPIPKQRKALPPSMTAQGEAFPPSMTAQGEALYPYPSYPSMTAQRKALPPSRTAPLSPDTLGLSFVIEVTPQSAPPPVQQANPPASNAISNIQFQQHESAGDSVNQQKDVNIALSKSEIDNSFNTLIDFLN